MLECVEDCVVAMVEGAEAPLYLRLLRLIPKGHAIDPMIHLKSPLFFFWLLSINLYELTVALALDGPDGFSESQLACDLWGVEGAADSALPTLL